MWNPKEIDKGRHPDTEKIEILFEYTGPKKIMTVSGSCDCTKIKLVDNRITGEVVPKKVSDVVPSMVTKKEYNSEHHITVFYTDHTHEVLKIKAIIVPNENTIGQL